MQEVDVIIGGGISGLLAGLILAERERRPVVLIEREPQVGGLLRKFDYGLHGIFDCGMHNMYETGIPELDELLFGLLPSDHWQLLEGNHRDLAGVIFNGSVQRNSPYPDLRSLPGDHWEACVTGFFRQLERPSARVSATAWDDACDRFGEPIAKVIDKALRNQFGHSADRLDPSAARLTTLSRVVLFGETVFADLAESPLLRDRLAWPEQRTLPRRWQSGRRSYYPREYGIHRVIDAMIDRFRKAGGEVLVGTQVNAIGRTAGRIASIGLQRDGSALTLERVGRLIWTTGLIPIAQLLGIPIADLRFDRPRRTIVVNLLLRAPPAMDDLYYLYCYETGCRTFRVTNFAGYCEGAPRDGQWPISVELLLDEPLPSLGEMQAIAIEELLRFAIIASPAEVAFAAAEPLGAGFPMPTTRNISNLAQVRAGVQSVGIDNLVMTGILSEPGIFFQRDVVAQTWNRLFHVETAHA